MVAVVQLVEHLVVVQDVAGSSPVSHPEGKGLGCENIRGLCVASRAAAGFLAPKQMPPFNPVSASHTCPVRGTVGAHPARFEHKVL